MLASSEAELQRAETHLVAVVGPLPQADHIEPFDAHDPAEPWELRVDLPGLAPARWPTVSAAMGPWEHELTPGAPPEVTTADDTGLRLVEWVDGGGLAARMPVAVDHGAVRLDIRRRPDAVGADDLARIEAQLAEALHRHSPRLRLISDRGHDTVTPVVHRTSGRPGLELCFDPEGFAGTDGDTVLTLRRAAVAALADVVRARADATTLRLAPDPHFELPLGSLSLLAWVVAPHGDPLPGDAPLLDARVPAPRALQALLQAGGQMAHDVEVQVLADADAALELIAASGAPWRGHVPRWVPTADGWRFATTWRAPLGPDLLSLLEQLPTPWRVVPGALVGLEEDDDTLIRSVVWGRERPAVRVRDAVRDRDYEPQAEVRPPTADDAPLMAAALPALQHLLGPAALQPTPDGQPPVQAVADGPHRGLRLELPNAALPRAHDLLEHLASAPVGAPWIDWSCPRRGGLRVWLWHPTSADTPRRWR
mgnify:FL=1